MDYQTCFRSEEAIQVLVKKLKNNSKNLEIFIDVLLKELEIIEFSRDKFKKISLKTREINSSAEFTSMRVAMRKMENFYLEKSKTLNASLEALRVQVLEPLQKLLIYQTQSRKSLKLNLEKALKEKQSTELAFYKSKDKYFSKQKELLSLKEGNVILVAKDAIKKEQRIEKLNREIEALDGEYQHNG